MVVEDSRSDDQIDEMIERYLDGKMSESEAWEFRRELSSNDQLSKLVSAERMIREVADRSTLSSRAVSTPSPRLAALLELPIERAKAGIPIYIWAGGLIIALVALFEVFHQPVPTVNTNRPASVAGTPTRDTINPRASSAYKGAESQLAKSPTRVTSPSRSTSRPSAVNPVDTGDIEINKPLIIER